MAAFGGTRIDFDLFENLEKVEDSLDRLEIRNDPLFRDARKITNKLNEVDLGAFINNLMALRTAASVVGIDQDTQEQLRDALTGKYNELIKSIVQESRAGAKTS